MTMTRAGTRAVSIIVLALSVALAPAAIWGQSTGTTLYVGGGPGTYASITTAVELALPGDTIYVYSGIYHENLRIEKPLYLIGEDRRNTVIDGGGAGNVIEVIADNASISNFRIQNAGYMTGAGVLVSSCQYSTITNNDIIHGAQGVFLSRANHATVSNNVIQDQTDGILFGGGTNCMVFDNYIRSCSNLGIHMKLESDLNTIRWNTIVNSGWRGFCKGSAGINNSIYNNNFCNADAETVNDPGTNYWFAAYPTGGNYYDEYTGADLFHGPNQDILGSDGIGDTPYYVHGDIGPVNIDLYPLMEPYGPGVVLDDTDPGFVAGGPWAIGPDPSAKGKTLHAIAGGSGSSFAAWRVDTVVPPGKYDVSLWKFEHPWMGLMASAAQVQIWHMEGASPWIPVDLSAPGTDWIDLGAFEFNASSIQGVVILDNMGGVIIADAVTLIPNRSLIEGGGTN